MPTVADLFVALALSMDSFAISMAGGVALRRRPGRAVVRMALIFGLFHIVMPLAGWVGTVYVSHYLETVGHWVAAALLAYIGGGMIAEAVRGGEARASLNLLSLRTQLALAVATSLDALAIGVSMACLGISRGAQLAVPLLTIGLTVSVMSLAGYVVGVRFGHTVASRLKPGLAGGIILLAIAAKVIADHWL